MWSDAPPDKEPPSKEVLEYNEILDQLKQTFDETDNRSKKLSKNNSYSPPKVLEHEAN